MNTWRSWETGGHRESGNSVPFPHALCVSSIQPFLSYILLCFPAGAGGKELACQEMPVRSLGQEDPLEKEMAIHSSIFAWEIPWTESPGRLQFAGIINWKFSKQNVSLSCVSLSSKLIEHRQGVVGTSNLSLDDQKHGCQPGLMICI